MAVCLSCRVAAAQHLLQGWSRLGWYPGEPSCSHNRAHIPAHGTTATTHSGLLARAAPPSIVSWLSVYPARLVEPLPVLTSRVLGARASLVGPSGREWTARVALHSCGSLYSAECTAGTAYIRETRQSHTRGQMSDERVQGAVRRAPPGVHVPGGARGRRRPPGCGGGADRDVPVQDRAHAHDCAPGAQPALTCRRLPLARCYAATSRQTWGRLRVARAAAGGLQPRVPCPGSAGAAAVSRVRMLQEREAAGAAECAAEAAQSSRDACGLVSNTLRQLCPRCTSISSHTARRPRPAAGRASSRCRGQRALCARRRASARSLCGRGPACARERGAPVMPRARRHARRAAAGPRAAVLVNCKKCGAHCITSGAPPQDRSARTVEFRLARQGAMRSFEGRWTVTPCGGGGSTVALEQHMQPAFVPPPPFRRFLRRALLGKAAHMLRDMQARRPRARHSWSPVHGVLALTALLGKAARVLRDMQTRRPPALLRASASRIASGSRAWLPCRFRALSMCLLLRLAAPPLPTQGALCKQTGTSVQICRKPCLLCLAARLSAA